MPTVKKAQINIDNSWMSTNRTALPAGVWGYSFNDFRDEGFEVGNLVHRKQTFLRNAEGELIDFKGKRLPKGAEGIKTPEEDCPLYLNIYEVDDNGKATLYSTANLSPKMKELYKAGDKLKASQFGVMYYEKGVKLNTGNTVSQSFLQITRPGGGIDEFVQPE